MYTLGTMRCPASFKLQPLTRIPPVEIETPRLKLKAFQPGDGQLLFDLYASDPNVCKYMSYKVADKPETSEAYVRFVVDSFAGQHNGVPDFAYTIKLKDSGEYIGSGGFGPSTPDSIVGGYILGQKFWGQGYATEAWRALLAVAQSDPGVNRIEANHHPENIASGKVMQAAGMMCVGIRPKHSVFPNISDEPVDDVLYAWTRL